MKIQRFLKCARGEFSLFWETDDKFIDRMLCVLRMSKRRVLAGHNADFSAWVDRPWSLHRTEVRLHLCIITSCRRRYGLEGTWPIQGGRKDENDDSEDDRCWKNNKLNAINNNDIGIKSKADSTIPSSRRDPVSRLQYAYSWVGGVGLLRT